MLCEAHNTQNIIFYSVPDGKPICSECLCNPTIIGNSSLESVQAAVVRVQNLTYKQKQLCEKQLSVFLSRRSSLTAQKECLYKELERIQTTVIESIREAHASLQIIEVRLLEQLEKASSRTQSELDNLQNTSASHVQSLQSMVNSFTELQPIITESLLQRSFAKIHQSQQLIAFLKPLENTPIQLHRQLDINSEEFVTLNSILTMIKRTENNNNSSIHRYSQNHQASHLSQQTIEEDPSQDNNKQAQHPGETERQLVHPTVYSSVSGFLEHDFLSHITLFSNNWATSNACQEKEHVSETPISHVQQLEQSSSPRKDIPKEIFEKAPNTPFQIEQDYPFEIKQTSPTQQKLGQQVAWKLFNNQQQLIKTASHDRLQFSQDVLHSYHPSAQYSRIPLERPYVNQQQIDTSQNRDSMICLGMLSQLNLSHSNQMINSVTNLARPSKGCPQNQQVQRDCFVQIPASIPLHSKLSQKGKENIQHSSSTQMNSMMTTQQTLFTVCGKEGQRETLCTNEDLLVPRQVYGGKVRSNSLAQYFHTNQNISSSQTCLKGVEINRSIAPITSLLNQVNQNTRCTDFNQNQLSKQILSTAFQPFNLHEKVVCSQPFQSKEIKSQSRDQQLDCKERRNSDSLVQNSQKQLKPSINRNFSQLASKGQITKTITSIPISSIVSEAFCQNTQQSSFYSRQRSPVQEKMVTQTNKLEIATRICRLPPNKSGFSPVKRQQEIRQSIGQSSFAQMDSRNLITDFKMTSRIHSASCLK